MAGAASAHQATATSRQGNGQERAGRARRSGADPQRPRQGKTAAIAEVPAALNHLSRLRQLADASPQVAQLRRLKALAAGQSTPMSQLKSDPEEEELVQGKFAGAELQPQLQQAPRANNTGLPDQLKSGIESLSGMSMDHVRVHYNSSQPAQLNALAYAQGSDIHLAPGQEQHLPHEAWHVVQQAQGRVKPTMQMKGGVEVNDDAGLEREADMMGALALSYSAVPAQRKIKASNAVPPCSPVQRIVYYHGGDSKFVESAIAKPHQAKETMGELGSKGMYYWKDDENAALISAIIYNEKKKWAVMKIDVNSEVLEKNGNATKLLLFPSDRVAPKCSVNGKKQCILGLHYRFVQDNMDTKLGDATPDNTIEGELDPKYKGLTGREFLDSFDIVTSPTKANEYRHEGLKQVRANDTGLTNIIYGEAKEGTKNTFSKTWEGIINDDGHQETMINMGLSKKEDVPAVLHNLNGKKGTVVKKV
jgi:hypothetical protein